jgi:NADH dehydrogenase (ubiquinone) 1 alpha subcomplex subunit 6
MRSFRCVFRGASNQEGRAEKASGIGVLQGSRWVANMRINPQETLNFWKQLTHVLKYFRAEEEPKAQLPKNFIQGFIEVRLPTHSKKQNQALTILCHRVGIERWVVRRERRNALKSGKQIAVVQIIPVELCSLYQTNHQKKRQIQTIRAPFPCPSKLLMSR